MPPKLPKGKKLVQRTIGFSDQTWDELKAESLRTGKTISLLIREAVRASLEKAA